MPKAILGGALGAAIPACALALATACSSDDTNADARDAFLADVSAHFNDVFSADVSAHFNDVFTGDVSAHFDASDANAKDATDGSDAPPDAPADGDSGEEAG